MDIPRPSNHASSAMISESWPPPSGAVSESATTPPVTEAHGHVSSSWPPVDDLVDGNPHVDQQNPSDQNRRLNTAKEETKPETTKAKMLATSRIANRSFDAHTEQSQPEPHIICPPSKPSNCHTLGHSHLPNGRILHQKQAGSLQSEPEKSDPTDLPNRQLTLSKPNLTDRRTKTKQSPSQQSHVKMVSRIRVDIPIRPRIARSKRRPAKPITLPTHTTTKQHTSKKASCLGRSFRFTATKTRHGRLGFGTGRRQLKTPGQSTHFRRVIMGLQRPTVNRNKGKDLRRPQKFFHRDHTTTMVILSLRGNTLQSLKRFCTMRFEIEFY